MKPPYSKTACAWVAVTAVALGCGPFFPDTMLDHPQSALAVPPVSYLSNLHKLAGNTYPKADLDQTGGDSLLRQIPLEVAELREIWEKEGIAEEEIENRVLRYTGVRTTMLLPLQEVSFRDFPTHPDKITDLQPEPLGEGFPTEVADYVEAARLYGSGKTEEARKLWMEILERPVADKRLRSLWAAWMLAKTSATTDESLEWYARVEEEAKLGGTDVLRLRAAAKSWRASRIKDPLASIHLLYESFCEGRESAAIDLRQTSAFLLSSEDEALLEAAAADPLVRRLLSMDLHAFLDSRGQMAIENHAEESKDSAWYAALEKQGDGAGEGAAEVAWALYSSGNYDESRRWLALASENDVLALWLQAKFDLRDGDTEAAAQHLSEAIRLRSSEADWDPSNYYSEGRWFESGEEFQALRDGRMLAEKGVVAVSQGEYISALQSLSDAGYWADASFVAENLISTDALLEHVRRVSPKWTKEEGDDMVAGERNYNRGADPGNRLRWVLARRLNRERRFAQASEFVPPDLAATLNRYIAVDQARRSGKFSGETQAAIVWEQALMHRHYGAELFSTESAPDGGYVGWNFPVSDLTVARSRKDGWARDTENWGTYISSQEPGDRAIPPVSSEEVLRMRKYGVKNRKRFHYRYDAADLGWEAAKSLPANHPLLAQLYTTAGLWIAHADPEAADRFYQALVRRCAKTEEGRAADAKKWFPADLGKLDSMPALPKQFRRNPQAEPPW